MTVMFRGWPGFRAGDQATSWENVNVVHRSCHVAARRHGDMLRRITHDASDPLRLREAAPPAARGAAPRAWPRASRSAVCAAASLLLLLGTALALTSRQRGQRAAVPAASPTLPLQQHCDRLEQRDFCTLEPVASGSSSGRATMRRFCNATCAARPGRRLPGAHGVRPAYRLWA